MNGKLHSKVAIVTGGSTGIGEAISRKFMREGAKVCIVDKENRPVDDLVDQLNNESEAAILHQDRNTAIGFSGDIGYPANAKKCIDKVIDQWGKLDILINNAGILPGRMEIQDFDDDHFESLLDENIKSTYYMTKYAIPLLQKSQGCIVSAGSEAGLQGLAYNAPYGGSKGWIQAFMEGVAVEQGKHGIRANTVCPGIIESGMYRNNDQPIDEEVVQMLRQNTVLERRGTPDEVANLYSFLASEEASYITGGMFPVDGGMRVSKGNIAMNSMNGHPETRREPLVSMR